jgi:hypothetical protein
MTDVEGLRRHAEERLERLRELLERLESEGDADDPVLAAVRSLLEDAERD